MVREGPYECYDCAFGRGVVEEIGAPSVWVFGGAGYYAGAGGHVWEGVFGEVEEWVYVGIEGFDRLLFAKLPNSLLQHLEPMVKH